VTLDPAALQQTARDHLWGHLSRPGVWAADAVAVIERGEGYDVWDMPIVGEIRGMGYFYGIELVKDPVTREVRRRIASTISLALVGAMKEMP
jgi:hypothetical protein